MAMTHAPLDASTERVDPPKAECFQEHPPAEASGAIARGGTQREASATTARTSRGGSERQRGSGDQQRGVRQR